MRSSPVKNITAPPLDRGTLSTLNKKTAPPIDRQSVFTLNHRGGQTSAPPPAARPAPRPVPPTPSPAPPRPAPPPPPASAPAPAPGVPRMTIPALKHPLQKGQKTSLGPQPVQSLRVCFGWNVTDPRCDLDASAFLLDSSGRVPNDNWFVFYSQVHSPDGSVVFHQEDPKRQDREVIQVSLDKLSPQIQKVTFVLTIHEALTQKLNFSMVQDAYVRILDGGTGQELVSYRLEDAYANVISMTIGELYLHKGQWKFNPVGNGVRQDLAGQCAIYGVELC
jgi:tellurium resistance protein TerD